MKLTPYSALSFDDLLAAVYEKENPTDLEVELGCRLNVLLAVFEDMALNVEYHAGSEGQSPH
jgi:hypothetical protein